VSDDHYNTTIPRGRRTPLGGRNPQGRQLRESGATEPERSIMKRRLLQRIIIIIESVLNVLKELTR